MLVHDRDAYLAALTRIPLDRTAEGTTGGAVDRLAGAGGLFDQQGAEHRRARRDVADGLGVAGVDRLRPGWIKLIDERLAPLGNGGSVDLVPLAAEIAGSTAAALLGLELDPLVLAAAAQEAGATAARAHLPGIRRRRAAREAELAAERLLELVGGGTIEDRPAGDGQIGHGPTGDGPTGHGPIAGGQIGDGPTGDTLGGDGPTGDGPAGGALGGGGPAGGALGGGGPAGGGPGGGGPAGGGLAATLAVAAVNTTVAALPRAAAWACADGALWAYAREPALADELLRVTSPTPLLPRVAAGGGDLGRCPVRAGDRMLLVARHAADAHHRDPDPDRPAPARTAQLVFGAGPHACPGARLARLQLGDFLAALAPHRPVVVRARVDRRSALPGWRSLIVRAA
ncbi:hypothetical protein Ato02nite_061070 [Paractinoplanes toevensis]|uniref:Cytochrome P450 n=1 Tax=Paractinoplanes toevensis TaxID=571911 RepID=A0A919TE40_9ACTN|nr:hypothetical protein Ato02nite_061070 [Actinoplanes toevensis]